MGSTLFKIWFCVFIPIHRSFHLVLTHIWAEHCALEGHCLIMWLSGSGVFRQPFANVSTEITLLYLAHIYHHVYKLWPLLYPRLEIFWTLATPHPLPHLGLAMCSKKRSSSTTLNTAPQQTAPSLWNPGLTSSVMTLCCWVLGGMRHCSKSSNKFYELQEFSA